ncbi:NRDE family protein [Flavihumibacter rivuli]|uniref:NRDE family protein n=1 Tax=Flavihumibacter rivuli TaxID=2838156 RepID=UPI001BDF7219|nr:NRDE family protein [Flavihumibacter rivuli]ULQ57862.1 NRDE family protein [Flavihumibacter rivuli]
MCTVTYLPFRDKVFLTSNRDEKKIRGIAIPPTSYEVNGVKLVYPRDPDAHGTWVAMHEAGHLAVLLNGGLVKHEPVYPYRRSRGMIFLDVVANEDMFGAYQRIDLHNIEPFTLILLQEGLLREHRWDGKKKHITELDPWLPQIWSSVTLYDQEVIDRRRAWFNEWLGNNPMPDAYAIQYFHQFGGNGDLYNGLRMNRNGEMLTVSITCMEKTEQSIRMIYHDLQENKKYQAGLEYSNVPELPS